MTASYWFQGSRGPGPDVGDPIGNSLRFRGRQRLIRTTTAAISGEWTYSFWFKHDVQTKASAADSYFFEFGTYSSPFNLYIDNYNSNLVQNRVLKNSAGNYEFTERIGDSSAWYHVVLSKRADGANTPVTEGWLNGRYMMAQNGIDLVVGDANPMSIGASTEATVSQYNSLKGYITEAHFVDGQALQPTAFGRYNAEGIWVPVKPDFGQSASGLKYSSYLTATIGSIEGSNPGGASNAFDGDLDVTTGRVYTSGGGQLTWAPPGVTFTDTLEIYNSNNTTNQTIAWGGNTVTSNGSWVTVATGGGTISDVDPLVITGLNAGTRAELHAVRLDGEILVDPNMWSADLYTQPETDTPNYNTTDQEFYFSGPSSSGPPSYAFDGSETTEATTQISPSNAGTWIIWRPRQEIIANSSVEVRTAFCGTITVNGTDTGITQTSTQATTVDLSSALTFPVTIETLGVQGNKTGETNTSEGRLHQIIIDGVVYVDGVNGNYGPQGFYLDFSDPNDLGADRSGNGNNFSPENFDTFQGTVKTDLWRETFRDYNAAVNFDNFLGETPYNPSSELQIGTSEMLLFELEYEVTSIDVVWNGGGSGIQAGNTTWAVSLDGSAGSWTEVISGQGVSGVVPISNSGSPFRFIRAGAATSYGFGSGVAQPSDQESWTYDWVLDSPTQNYNTMLGHLPAYTTNLSDAMLNTDGDGTWRASASQFSLSSGKWMWEVQRAQAGGYIGVLAEVASQAPDYLGTNAYPAFSIQLDLSPYSGTARYYVNNTATAGTQTGGNYGDIELAGNETITVLLDADAGTIAWNIDGQISSTPPIDYTAWLDVGPVIPCFCNLAAYNTPVNFGQQPFKYPVEGYKPLSTLELPSAPIVDGREHFRALTAPGSTLLQTVIGNMNGYNGTGFPRAMWWTKEVASSGNFQLIDYVRNGFATLNTDTNNGQGAFATPGGDCVAWCFKAGETIESNNDGATQTMVSANPDAGFSIVTYTAPGSATTLGHGLTKAPELIISKRYDGTASWAVYHKSAGNGSRGTLDENFAFTSTGIWNNTDPTDTVWSVGAGASDNNTLGEENVAYCFHSVPGYCKIGNYVGNNDAEGPVIQCGFKPAWVMIKCNSRAGDWVIWDGARSTANSLQQTLRPNQTGPEEPNYPIDFLAHGFKIRTAGGDINTSSDSFTYIAIAQYPQGSSKHAPANAGFNGPIEYQGITPGMATSLRFRGGMYLNRSIQWGTHTTTSFWVKKAFPTKEEYMVGSYSGGVLNQILFLATGALQGDNTGASSSSVNLLRDTTSWYHLVFARGPGANRLYVNGKEVDYSSFGTTTGGQVSPIDFTIGALNASATSSFEGYMSDFHFIANQQLTADAFGEYNEDGIWVAKEYTGDYGDWGFHLIFDPAYLSGSNTLLDQSGNGRDFTMYGFGLTDPSSPNYDFMRDGPQTNYAVLNPLTPVQSDSYPGGTKPYADANLKAHSGGIQSAGPWSSTIGISPSDNTNYYAEYNELTVASGRPRFGVIQVPQWNAGLPKSPTYNPTYLNYMPDGTIGLQPDNVNDTRQVLYTVDTFTNGDYVGVSYNALAGIVNFFKNGVLQAQVSYDNMGYDAMMVGELTGAGDNFTANFGQRPYVYPTQFNFNYNNNGVVASSAPSPITLPSEHFKVARYTGTGSTQKIDLDFQPDFTWIKISSASSNHSIYDSLRGPDKMLSSSSDGVEVTDGLVTPVSDGFTVGADNTIIGSTNGPGNEYTAWCWKGGGAAVANNDGDIASQVSANTVSGFSVVTYTGNNTVSQTVGHGLDKAPELIILKNRDRANTSWLVLNTSLEASGTIDSGAPLYPIMRLDSTDNAGVDTEDNVWDPTTTTFRVRPSTSSAGNWCNNNDDFVAYCWHSVPGFSKVGYYIGDGNDNGAYVHCGFKPAFIMYKRTDTAGYAWDMIDVGGNAYNPWAVTLSAQAADAYYSAQIRLDAYSQGFKMRAGSAGSNGAQATYAFVAFAEAPPNSSLAG